MATIEQVRPTRATGRYTMREVRSVTREEWDSWLERSPGGGHIYQSYEWGEFKRGQGWRPVRLVLERGGEVVGCGQFLVYRTPLVGGALMYCAKGPWIEWGDREAVRTFFGGVRTVARREGVHTVKIEPEVRERETAVKDLLRDVGFGKARWNLQFKTTMVVDLSPPEEEVLARMKPKTRYNIRLAERKGVKIVEDNSVEARGPMYDLMRVTKHRDGLKSRRSHEYHESQLQTMYDNGRAHMFFATYEGDRLALIVIYTFGKKYWYKRGASSNEKRNLMPTYLLQWEVMRWAKRHGYTYYDMVAIPNPNRLNESSSMWGLYRFKSGFGGEIAEFLGCLDMRVRKLQAWAWYKFEPVYFRAYLKLKCNIYY